MSLCLLPRLPQGSHQPIAVRADFPLNLLPSKLPDLLVVRSRGQFWVLCFLDLSGALDTAAPVSLMGLSSIHFCSSVWEVLCSLCSLSPSIVNGFYGLHDLTYITWHPFCTSHHDLVLWTGQLTVLPDHQSKFHLRILALEDRFGGGCVLKALSS